MDAFDELKRYKLIVDSELQLFFKNRKAEMKKTDPFSLYLIELIEDFTMRGGKRIRPALMYYGYRLFERKGLPEVIKGSIAFELIQTYLLIHDDIIDKDDFRRGKPTMHRMLEHGFRKRYGDEGSEHFSTSMAIIAGDISSHLANLVLLNMKMPSSRKVMAATEFNRLIHRVVHGEALDVLANHAEDLSEADIVKIHTLKTAAYTFEAPLLVGATLAGAKPKDLNALSGYAIPLGQAFQLQDDILGLFGDEKKLGKPIGSDLKEGKQTLLILKALENADTREKALIKSIMGKQEITKDDIEDIKTIMITTGSLDYSRTLARKLIRESKKHIEKMDADKTSKDFLIGIADYMLRRDY